ncbi:thioredoxin domain-containing protein [Geminisphaera colitermitum]|uniref:thioredoxin domain-containing protein n=1 Tax=Geminisphaera colitermitum TaxID=1148786 RepID=UPI000158CBB1|nr:thioredoxin domain-containing protein [Geminisphaera colitermitum]
MPNRLAFARSPYLQQHAGNPVHWQEWGEAAFAEAHARQVPIFLSIGYSTCHWCHVMARESFENESVAAVLNEHFVSIKVDREERPDVDRIYMAYVQAMTGRGGWPLSAWLTPDLKPFYGGTYFPPHDQQGRPGFLAVLHAITEAWSDEAERHKLVAESARVIQALTDYHAGKQHASVPAHTRPLHDRAADAFEHCFLQLRESFDPAHGGFGGAPKFPRASNLDFLFRVAAIQGTQSEVGREAVKLATTTLRHMIAGGIHDHVGGGFHRYAVDETWLVPHFEKMLYDQAQIAVNLLDAALVTGDERYAWVARSTLDYVLRDLRHPAGGFFSAEDADSAVPHDDGDASPRAHGNHAEGAFYVWTTAELRRILPSDTADRFILHFGVAGSHDANAAEAGNVPPAHDPHGELSGKNILHHTRPIAETAAALGLDPAALAAEFARALETLRAVRAARPRPHLDDKIITAWNGLAITAFARAAASPAACLDDRREFYLDAALTAARFIERELYDDDGGDAPARCILWRNWRDGRGASEGFAEDYAFLIAGLLDLHEATLDPHWLRRAARLQETMDHLFWDDAHGGYFNTPAGSPHLVLRLKEDYDGAEPAPGSIAAANLQRLSALFQDDTLHARAVRTVESLRGQWETTPHALPALLFALERILEEPAQIILAGDPRSHDFRALAAVLRARDKTLRRHTILAAPLSPALPTTDSPNSDEAWLLERAPWLAGMKPSDGCAAAYVCHGRTCHPPVTTPSALRQLLA